MVRIEAIDTEHTCYRCLGSQWESRGIWRPPSHWVVWRSHPDCHLHHPQQGAGEVGHEDGVGRGDHVHLMTPWVSSFSEVLLLKTNLAVTRNQFSVYPLQSELEIVLHQGSQNLWHQKQPVLYKVIIIKRHRLAITKLHRSEERREGKKYRYQM